MTSEGSSSVQVTITNSINFSELAVNVYLNTINSGSAKGSISIYCHIQLLVVIIKSII